MPTNVAPASPRAQLRAGRRDADGGPSAARTGLSIVLLGFALVVAVQLLPWFGDMDPRVPFGLIRPLLYFTVQSNLVAVVVLVLSAIALLRGRVPSRATEYLRGLATVDLAITGIVYGLLLSDGGGDAVLHTVMPVVMAVWWIALPPREAMRWRAVPLWLLHPVAWLAVVFGLRAVASDHWVPYYFLDPRQVGGWEPVAGYSAAIVGVVAVLGAIAVLVNRVVPWRGAAWRSLRIGGAA